MPKPTLLLPPPRARPRLTSPQFCARRTSTPSRSTSPTSRTKTGRRWMLPARGLPRRATGLCLPPGVLPSAGPRGRLGAPLIVGPRIPVKVVRPPRCGASLTPHSGAKAPAMSRRQAPPIPPGLPLLLKMISPPWMPGIALPRRPGGKLLPPPSPLAGLPNAAPLARPGTPPIGGPLRLAMATRLPRYATCPPPLSVWRPRWRWRTPRPCGPHPRM